MHSKKLLIIACFFLAVSVTLTISKKKLTELNSLPSKICSLTFDSTTLHNVPQAITVAQMERGLSNTLDVSSGMLFTWDDEAVRGFWMKNTPAPLSIAFINMSGEVTQIVHMKPNSEKIHLSHELVSEALELKKGEFQRLGISVGSQLISRSCKDK